MCTILPNNYIIDYRSKKGEIQTFRDSRHDSLNVDTRDGHGFNPNFPRYYSDPPAPPPIKKRKSLKNYNRMKLPLKTIRGGIN